MQGPDITTDFGTSHLCSTMLSSRGYVPLPVNAGDKYCRLAKWQHLKDWIGTAAGLGTELSGLAMIDLDLDDKAAAHALYDVVTEVLGRTAYRYRDNSSRLALLYRFEEPHVRVVTPKYACGRVEFKLGSGEFMFMAGTHPSGAPLRWYFDTVSSVVPPMLAWLPKTTREKVNQCVEAVNAWLEENGGDRIDDGSMFDELVRVEDMTWDMVFTTDTGSGTLRDLYHPNSSMFVNLTPWRPQSDSMGGHLLHSFESDGPMVIDFVTGTVHHMAPRKAMEAIPGFDFSAPMLATPKKPAPENDAPDPGLKKHVDHVSRLLFVRDLNKYIYAGTADSVEMVEGAAFHGLSRKVVGELKAMIPVADRMVWDPGRAPLEIEEQPNGAVEYNTFSPPIHYQGNGNTDAFWEYFERFIPDRRERSITTEWLANKIHRPRDRGFCSVFVGPQGSGKGTLWRVIKSLWGDRLVTNIAGIGPIYDSTYQDALLNVLWVLIDEVSLEDVGFRGKKKAEEVLKGIIEPQASTKLLNIKGRHQTPALVCSTFGIATNNHDALPLSHANDRRFFVAQTGPEMTHNQVSDIQSWLANPANVAALWYELSEVRITHNMMRAPASEAKSVMVESSQSELDELVGMFRGLVEAAGGIYTGAAVSTFAARAEPSVGPRQAQTLKRLLRGLAPTKSIRFSGGPRRVRVLSQPTDPDKALQDVLTAVQSNPLAG